MRIDSDANLTLTPIGSAGELRLPLGGHRRRDVLLRGGGARRAGLETLEAIEALDVDCQDLFGGAGEDAGELRVPADLVPPVRRTRRDAGGEGFLVRVDENE